MGEPTTQTTPGDAEFLRVNGVTKSFGGAPAVDDVSLTIAEGEFVSLLGPSGSGKTTTLQMIAGFSDPDSGTIALGGRDLASVPTHKRDIGVVFQNYALFPHMTVAQNVAFPLKMRGVPRREAESRVRAALEQVHLAKFSDRKPAQLSGGQQQRVALARAFVFGAKLLLMDEPLGALDKKLREVLQEEIVHLARSLGVTVVYVTHDQEEALAMSDRIAIYNEGRIEQIGSGRDLYARPATLFVATFMGESNIVRGALAAVPSGSGDAAGAPGIVSVETPAGVFAGVASEGLDASAGRACLMVRPEHVRIGEAPVGAPRTAATVRGATYLGSSLRVSLEVPGIGTLTSRQSESAAGPDGNAGLRPGDAVEVWWRTEEAVVLAEGGEATLTSTLSAVAAG
ncbi:ABC transporter ATP-binding protein [Leucobacter soli]|uniref:Spermidine/putrescine import ATP-binding protein PotA n=3 Tax=Leucobacter soli TaxID=2812850 RepID=A0A916JXH9_9MICO|nr:ABC transporter ATP-binding protein [Leucobacter soli]CAG7610246.1 Spermidine/putrescine import ATP-binding protein PotA [Leucobacter soli]